MIKKLKQQRRQKTEQSDAEAQYIMGNYYSDWADWCEQYAAESRYAYGLEDLAGELYVKAIEWYRKAAAQRYKEALLYLGHLYLYEERVELEYYEIIECYKMMAEEGDEDERESGIVGLEEAARDGDLDIRDYLKVEFGTEVR